MPQEPHPQVTRFYQLWREVADLGSAAAILSWDQETQMPPKGQQGRGKVLATLAGLRHERLTAPELQDALQACEEIAHSDSELQAQTRQARRQVNRAAKIPGDLAKALAEASSTGQACWQQARKDADFGSFEAALHRLVALRKEEAAALSPGGNPYDALMDEYEPGAKEADLKPLFDALRTRLGPLAQAVRETGKVVDETVARGSFPADRQLAFGRMVAEKFGYDFGAGRIDLATHPFCIGFHNKDVRITWRYQEDDFRPALYGILHETGHGLYEQGLPDTYVGTPLGQAVSLGVHESQSRLWENLVGRSKAFWRWALPYFKQYFPAARDFDVDEIWPALHTVQPSLIRVEADEGTYDLHVAVRFEVERRLFADEVEVTDLPALWDQLYDEILGVRPDHAALGVLQDIHWSMGMFGYFPTYTLGNLMNSQLFAKIQSDLGDLERQIERGEFDNLLQWLREKVHQQGARYTAQELMQKSTGEALNADYHLQYLQQHAEQVYGI